MTYSRYFSWSPHQGRRRVIVKTLCYRLVMVAITVAVAWWITGSTAEALSIGLVANVAKTGTYYAYERVWDHIRWGIEAPSS